MKVNIVTENGDYNLYSDRGAWVAGGFDSKDQATEFANNNGYTVIGEFTADLGEED